MVEVVRLGRDKAPGGKQVKERIRRTEKQNEYAHENIKRGKHDNAFKNGDQGSFSVVNVDLGGNRASEDDSFVEVSPGRYRKVFK